MDESNYAKPRSVLQLINKVLWILGLLAAVIVFIAGMATGNPLFALLGTTIVLINVGLSYGILHGVLAVFDIADNTAKQSEVVVKTVQVPAPTPASKPHPVDLGYITSSGPQRRT